MREHGRMTHDRSHPQATRCAIRTVLPFVFRHWRSQPVLAPAVGGGLFGAIVADLFMPVFSGQLVDALTRARPIRPRATRREGLRRDRRARPGVDGPAPGRTRAIVPFTLRIMSDVARDAFMRVQRFSTDWHANSFAGSTVRKITRGMWALDLLNDTILMALLPSLVVLLGSMSCSGCTGPSLGLVVASAR